MLDFYRLGINPLDGEGISMGELSSLTIEFLGRATEDPIGGQLNADIATVATGLQDFDVTLTGETVKLGVQIARTAAKGEFRAALTGEIARLHGAVVMKVGLNAAKLAEYFPEGREVFGDCVESLLDNKLGALRDAIVLKETASPGFFPAETITLANALVTTWQALYGAATTGRSQRKQTAAERRGKDKALRTALYRVMLKIASIFAGQLAPDGSPLGAERITHYFPQHLVEDAPSGNPPQG